MTNEPSPRPWRVADYAQCPGLADVFDASGSPSGLVAGELKPADAELIVDAVNAIEETKKLSIKLYDPIRRAEAERDRLRDIVRRLARVADDTLNFAEAMCGIIPDNPERAKARSEIEALLREARAALGEVEK